MLVDVADRAVAERRPAGVVVIGDPGAGKSRLLAEAVSRSSIRRLVRVRGFEPEAGVALAAAGELLAELAAVPRAGSALDARLHGESLAPIEPVAVFEAAHRALEALGPVLLLADDLHWTDPTSLALLHYLVRAADAEQVPVALIGATRPDPGSGSLLRSLRGVLGDRVRTIELGPLDRVAGVRLVLDLAPGLGERGAVEVWRRARGSPFWIEIIAGAGTAESEEAVLDLLLRGSDADAVDLLALLALTGNPLAREDLADIEGWPPERVGEAALSLLRSGLAVERDGSVAVSHDLVREAVVRRLPHERRRRTHRLLSEWLERDAGEDHLALLAAVRHRHEGGLAATDLARRLLGSPRRRLLGAEGVGILGAVADETSDLGPEVAALAMDVGEYEEALRRWAAEARSAGDPGERARAALEAARAAHELERLDQARAYLDLASAGAADDPILAVEVDAHRSEILRWLAYRPEDAKAAGVAALTAARALAGSAGGPDRMEPRARRAYVRALAVMSDVGLQEEDPAGMLEIAEETSAAAAGFDLRAFIGALNRSGYALFALGRREEAETRLRAAWDEARRAGLYVASVDAGWWLTRSLYHWGRLDEAYRVGRECASLGRRIGKMPRSVSTWLHAAGISAREWGPEVEALREEIDREPDTHFRLMAREVLALALARVAGDTEGARKAAGLARREAQEVGCPRCLGEVLLRGAEVLARTGDADEARVWLVERGGPENEPYPLARWWHDRARASIATARREADAGARLEAVAADAERLGLELEAVWARLDLGTHLSEADRRRAADVLRTAGAAAERLGARAEAAVAERALRSLGVRTWRRGPAAAGEGLKALTEREREIARLVAAGASNPDIARRLFLSRKTVERHVSNLIAKLGVRNRVEVAALLGRPGQGTPEDEGAPR